MKKTVYITCGKVFKDCDTALEYIFDRYTPTCVQDAFGNVKEANCAAAIKRMARGEYEPVPCRLNLPQSVSLKDKMRPVRNQAFRGTCAANAGAALMEYYEGGSIDLSVQYLYERMKRCERDAYRKAAAELASGQKISDPEIAEEALGLMSGMRNRAEKEGKAVTVQDVAANLYRTKVEMDGGSTAKYVFSVLEEYGICREELWPYAREQIDEKALVTEWNNRDMPPGADEDAKRHRLCDKPYMFTSSNNVEELKKYLAGDIYHEPMPIYIGARLFADEKNCLPLENGFAKLPRIVEIQIGKAICDIDSTRAMDAQFDMSDVDPDTVEPCRTIEVFDMKRTGGHAMLLVGYEDDDSVAGGGYFIVRNSWGGDWGEAGYGKLPYAYAELFITSAATILRPPSAGLAGAVTNQDSFIPEELKPYIITADRDMKNSRGVWAISKGAKVIRDADGIAEPDNELNRRTFIAAGYSWRNANARNSTAAAVDAKTGALLPSAGPQDRGRFLSGLEAGFGKLPLKFPVLGGIKKGLLGLPEATNFKKVADLSDRFGDVLNIYSVSGKKNRFRIAAVYLSSAKDAGEKAEKARALIADYSSSRRFDQCDSTIAVVAANEEIADAVQPYDSGSDVRIVADAYSPAGGWRLSAPAKGKDDVWFEWLKRLVPNAPGQWAARLSSAWEDIAASGGNVTLEKMSARTKLPAEELKAFAGEFLAGYKIKGDKIIKS